MHARYTIKAAWWNGEIVDSIIGSLEENASGTLRGTLGGESESMEDSRSIEIEG